MLRMYVPFFQTQKFLNEYLFRNRTISKRNHEQKPKCFHKQISRETSHETNRITATYAGLGSEQVGTFSKTSKSQKVYAEVSVRWQTFQLLTGASLEITLVRRVRNWPMVKTRPRNRFNSIRELLKCVYLQMKAVTIFCRLFLHIARKNSVSAMFFM